ncbi:MAG: helix-turn-helix domain-containing protein, partial [Patescibacteria group bacterium]
MLNNTDSLLAYFRELGLSTDEARVYIELLKGPDTHLRLSRSTGVNRTRIYRIANLLEKRSLITRQSDERGAFLVAADPATLQVDLVSREEKIKQQRETLQELAPSLERIRSGIASDFAVHAYEGIEGFKQMLWHELKANGECLCFGSGEMEKLVPDKRWAEKHRVRTMEAGYFIREILNPGGKPEDFTRLIDFKKSYAKRIIPEHILLLRQ